MDSPPLTDPSVTYDGTNPLDVLTFLRENDADLVRGGVVLQPLPGDQATITVEYADGTVLTVDPNVTLNAVDVAGNIEITGGALASPPAPVTA